MDDNDNYDDIDDHHNHGDTDDYGDDYDKYNIDEVDDAAYDVENVMIIITKKSVSMMMLIITFVKNAEVLQKVNISP